MFQVGAAVLRTTCLFLARLILLEGFPVKFVQDLIAWYIVREGKKKGLSDGKLAELVDWSRQNVTFQRKKKGLESAIDVVSLQSSLLVLLIEKGPIGCGALFDEARRRNLGALRKERTDQDGSGISMATVKAALDCLQEKGEVATDDSGDYFASQGDRVSIWPRTLGEHQRRVLSKTNNELLASLQSLEMMPEGNQSYSRQVAVDGVTVSQSRDVITISGDRRQMIEALAKVASETARSLHDGEGDTEVTVQVTVLARRT